VQYHLQLLAQALDRVLFVHITREPIDVMSSLLRARKAVHGTDQEWWGCRPPGSEAFADADPALQVAAQVAFTERSIQSELGTIPAHQQLHVRYEELCAAPADVWERLREMIVASSDGSAADTSYIAPEYPGPASFSAAGRTAPDSAHLMAAWREVTAS
jgi:hypothetical protein